MINKMDAKESHREINLSSGGIGTAWMQVNVNGPHATVTHN